MEWTLRGYRNGYEGKRVHSAEGTIGLEVPQIRGSLERLESVWLRANGKRSKRLLELVPMLYFKGMSSATWRRLWWRLWGRRRPGAA